MARQKNDGRGRIGGARKGRRGEHYLGRDDQVNALIDKGKPAGMHNDGNGLYLRITPTGSSSWMYRYMQDGKPHALGLGSTAIVTVEAARERAKEFFQAKAGRAASGDRVAKVDPLAVRDERDAKAMAMQTAQRSEPEATMPTFGEIADAYLTDMHEAWKDRTEAGKWRSMLARYASKLMPLPVDTIETDMVLDILKPLWATRYKLGKTLQRRIEAVMNAAIVRVPAMRGRANPARWKGYLAAAGLKAPEKAKKIEHRKSLGWQDIPAFVAELHGSNQLMKARAVEFVILTAARSGMVLHGERSDGMKWTTGEVNFDTATWTVPDYRMKKSRTHRVALSDRAVAILREMETLRTSDLVFDVGYDTVSKHFLKKLRDVDFHGFRQSFANWLRDTRGHDEDLGSQALSHKRDDETKASYFTSDGLDNRRPVMQAWTDFCLGRATVKAAA